jgi:hypothetical protein
VFENSWWDAPDGPSGDGPGSGDPLTVTGLGSVDFDPFQTLGCPLDFYRVTTTADSGPGSLRDVIGNVNAAPGPHHVEFDIPSNECSAAGVCTIVLSSALPLIEEPVIIDGTTQQPYGTAPANVCATVLSPSYMRVEVDGLALGSGTILEFDNAGAAGVSEIRGLSLYTSFLGKAIELTTSGAHRVQCNHLGVDGPGTTVIGATTGVLLQFAAEGVFIGTDGDGVDDLAERNVFSGYRGVNINANNDNVVAGNYFGTTSDGSTALAGCATGVYMRQGSANNRVGSNLDGTSDDLEANVFAGCTTHERIAANAVAEARRAGVAPADVARAMYGARWAAEDVARPGVEPDVGAEADEAAARRELRRQIARLEADLAAYPESRPDSETHPLLRPKGHLPDFAELSAARDTLIERLRSARSGAARKGERQARAHARREQILGDPDAHRWNHVGNDECGDPGCGEIRAVPRYGPLGAIAGWWRVKISSGCP